MAMNLFHVCKTVSWFDDEQGNPACVASVMTDITERKLAEEALRQRRDEFQMIYDNMLEGCVITDIETKRFMRVNVQCARCSDIRRKSCFRCRSRIFTERVKVPMPWQESKPEPRETFRSSGMFLSCERMEVSFTPISSAIHSPMVDADA